MGSATAKKQKRIGSLHHYQIVQDKRILGDVYVLSPIYILGARRAKLKCLSLGRELAEK